MDDTSAFFYSLTPSTVLSAVEKTGVRCTGKLFAHASMENRVYEVEIEDHDRDLPEGYVENVRIVKFYRPGRWTREQIQDEHDFLFDLTEGEIPCVAPLRDEQGTSIYVLPETEIFYTLFPKVRGRTLDELQPEQLRQIGRLLGRLHNIGARRVAKFRETLDVETFGRDNLRYLMEHKVLPESLAGRYSEIVTRICDLSDPLLKRFPVQRIHGDCHGGNVLWNGEQCFLVDFDDMLQGPCVQDLWLLTAGRDEEAKRKRELIITGYEIMRNFDERSLVLIEPLRALRMIRFGTWIARRWADPAFQRTFVRFGTPEFWREELIALEEALPMIEALRYEA